MPFQPAQIRSSPLGKTLYSAGDANYIIENRIRRRSDYIIGFITPAIGPNKSKKLTRPIVPTHNLRGKV